EPVDQRRPHGYWRSALRELVSVHRSGPGHVARHVRGDRDRAHAGWRRYVVRPGDRFHRSGDCRRDFQEHLSGSSPPYIWGFGRDGCNFPAGGHRRHDCEQASPVQKSPGWLPCGSCAGEAGGRSGENRLSEIESMVLLEAKHVSKRFGGLKAVNDVSFAVSRGEITFIVGPNGAGKTTLFNLITGVVHPDSGSIYFQDQDITKLAPDQAAKLGIGRTFQIVKPLRNLTVLENVMLGAFLRTSKPAQAEEEARGILTFLQMEKFLHLPARGMGLPMLKRLEIARALATQPKLILLDEVVAGLPTVEAIKLAMLLKRLPEWGISAIGGIEHVMQVVMKIADRVIVIDHGVLIAEGKPQEVVDRPEVIEAYLGPKYKEIGL